MTDISYCFASNSWNALESVNLKYRPSPQINIQSNTMEKVQIQLRWWHVIIPSFMFFHLPSPCINHTRHIFHLVSVLHKLGCNKRTWVTATLLIQLLPLSKLNFTLDSSLDLRKQCQHTGFHFQPLYHIHCRSGQISWTFCKLCYNCYL